MRGQLSVGGQGRRDRLRGTLRRGRRGGRGGGADPPGACVPGGRAGGRCAGGRAIRRDSLRSAGLGALRRDSVPSAGVRCAGERAVCRRACRVQEFDPGRWCDVQGI
ncbi:hypothetical protein C5E02_01360 [Rathayibacter rathayi]|uniref:Uncharacterized protein n=1 Tax=Rathayibacter rathayi TaxID=33887 RepID=A0ABX5ABH3_RATRA|nr:hypothetical protein C1O28_01450 [Rathayibacter rathayi]PPF50537.1 hypothetical protein C5C08_04760 [Rathayibacter rathayi]PPF81109.1 hypothetical protein C5C14_05325 [Rathayibacter rathayi]PPG13650.1 hypothetical protein C5C11_06655 [Rathayibacter rathayi]PPG45309.1 hypothetical protein C5C20_04575 [Rathayibacter rathayi]